MQSKMCTRILGPEGRIHMTLSHCHHYTEFTVGVDHIKCCSGIFCRVCSTIKYIYNS